MSDDPCFVKGLAALNHMVCGPPEPEDDGCEECERLRAEVDRLERALNGAVKKLTRLEAARAARVSKSSSITGGGDKR